MSKDISLNYHRLFKDLEAFLLRGNHKEYFLDDSFDYWVSNILDMTTPKNKEHYLHFKDSGKSSLDYLVKFILPSVRGKLIVHFDGLFGDSIQVEKKYQVKKRWWSSLDFSRLFLLERKCTD